MDLALRVVCYVILLPIDLTRTWTNNNLWIIRCCGIAIRSLVCGMRRVLLVGHGSSDTAQEFRSCSSFLPKSTAEVGRRGQYRKLW